jgi:hypothetical protein
MQIGSGSPESLGGQLSFNLSHTEKIDQRIQALGQRRERNDRLDMMRASLALENSTRDLKRLIEKGMVQEGDSGTATATSSASQGLNTLTDLDSNIEDVSELSGISSGNVIINGIKVEIDTANDSINDVINNINSAVSDVTASYDATENKFIISSSEDMALSNGSSNFFNELGVESGEISNGASEGQVNFFSTDKFKEAMKRFAANFNKALKKADELKLDTGNTGDDEVSDDFSDFISKVREVTENAFANTVNEDFSGVGKARLDFGMTFSFESGDFVSFDVREYKKKIESEVELMTEFFTTAMDPKDETSGGMFDQLLTMLSDYNDVLDKKSANTPRAGLLINLEA